MSRKNRIIAASIAGIALLGGGAAIAQGKQDRPDLTRSAATQHAAAMFDRMDVNGDGQLDEADREVRQEERFAALDTDGNGAISQEEFAAARTERGERGEARMGRGGGHHGEGRHGKRGMRGEGFHGGGAMRGMMARTADADQDGSISQAEFTGALLARFDAADADNDGTLTSAERQAQREKMRERFQQMRDTRALAEDAAE